MIAWLAAAAHAQVDLTPAIPADPLRPVLDGGPFLATEEAVVTPGVVAAARISWAHRPLVFDPDDGPPVDLLREVVIAHVGASVGIGPVRVGISAPAVLVATGSEWSGSAPLLGDPTATAKVGAAVGPVGVAAVGRLGVPLGASARQLGYEDPFGELGAAADLRAGRWRVALNGGLRFEPAVDLGEQVLDDAAWLRAGVAWRADRFMPSLEVAGQRPLRGFVRGTGPLEGLASVRYAAPRGPSLELGIGRGLTSGIGAPAWRLVAGATIAVE